MAPFNTWSDFYGKNGESCALIEPTRGAVLPDLTVTLAGHPNRLLQHLKQQRFNYMLIMSNASRHKSVSLVHNVQVVEPDDGATQPFIVCAQGGTRAMTVIKSFSADDATKAMQLPAPSGSRRRGEQASLTVPTYEQMIACSTASEFENLNGPNEDGISVDTLERWPSCCVVHSNVFGILLGQKELKAGETAVKLMKFCQGSPTLHEEVTGPFKNEEIHCTLIFLWATAKGFVKKTPLVFPESELAEDAINGIHNQIFDINRRVQMPDPVMDGQNPGQNRNSDPENPGRSDEVESEEKEDQDQLASIGDSKNNDEEDIQSDTSAIPNQNQNNWDSDEESNDEIDANGGFQLRDLLGNPRAGGNSTLDSNAVAAALVAVVNDMNKSQKEQRKRDDKKKSLFSKMTSEAEWLFINLCAKNWKDDNPRLNKFIGRIVADKDLSKAVRLVQQNTSTWRGKVCHKGLVQFLTSGYENHNLGGLPGGFTIFMFHASEDTLSTNPKDRLNQILAMFGEDKTNEETARHYSDLKYFVATDFDTFTWQLETCVEFLELCTRPDGIASSGYKKMLDLLQENREPFREAFKGDPHFGLKAGYFLDRIFQQFVKKLLKFQHVKRPIREAAVELKHAQSQQVLAAFRGMTVGIIPNIALPVSFSSYKMTSRNLPPMGGKILAPDGEPPSFDSIPNTKYQDKKPSSVVRNTNRFKEWAIPEGERFGNYFNATRKPNNVKDWPAFPNQSSGKMEKLCLRFHTTGQCRSDCTMSHVNPKDIPKAEADKITTRLQEIYKS